MSAEIELANRCASCQGDRQELCKRIFALATEKQGLLFDIASSPVSEEHSDIGASKRSEKLRMDAEGDNFRLLSHIGCELDNEQKFLKIRELRGING